jgi:hypothetical protein
MYDRRGAKAMRSPWECLSIRRRAGAGLMIIALVIPFAFIGCGGDGPSKPNNDLPAGTLRIEAETYTGEADNGGGVIERWPCGAASAGYGVDGLDNPGDLIRIPLSLTEARTFSDSLRSAGLAGLERTFAIWFRLGDTVVARDTLQSGPGSGVT